jgi:hypothetical protein
MVMHALCVFVVACAVAAGAAGGTAHGEARAGALAAALTHGAQPVLRPAAVHPALHAVIARNGRPRGARASHASPPPVALAAGWSFDLPRRAMTAPSLPVEDRRTGRPIRTGSARGPPIA